MNTKFLSILTAAALALTGSVLGSPAKTYQVTGPVLEATDSLIAVQKGKDRWEVARDPSTTVDGELKVGEKVTVTYTMVATKVEAKSTGKETGKTAATPAASASPTKK